MEYSRKFVIHLGYSVNNSYKIDYIIALVLLLGGSIRTDRLNMVSCILLDRYL